MYACHQGRNWSAPVRIFHSDRDIWGISNLVTHEKNSLFLIFSAFNPSRKLYSLYHVRKKIDNGWKRPQPFVPLGNDANMVNYEDRLMLTYTSSELSWAKRVGYDTNSVFIKTTSNNLVWAKKASVVHHGGRKKPGFHPQLYYGKDGLLHLFWFQGNAKEDLVGDNIIHTASKKGKEWSKPQKIIDESANSNNLNLSAMAITQTADGNMYVAYILSNGFTPKGTALYIIHWDGTKWSHAQKLFHYKTYGQSLDLVFDKKKHKLHLFFVAISKSDSLGKLYQSTYRLKEQR